MKGRFSQVVAELLVIFDGHRSGSPCRGIHISERSVGVGTLMGMFQMFRSRFIDFDWDLDVCLVAATLKSARLVTEFDVFVLHMEAEIRSQGADGATSCLVWGKFCEKIGFYL